MMLSLLILINQGSFSNSFIFFFCFQTNLSPITSIIKILEFHHYSWSHSSGYIIILWENFSSMDTDYWTPNFCVKQFSSFYSAFVFKKTYVRVEQYSSSGSIIGFHWCFIRILFLHETKSSNSVWYYKDMENDSFLGLEEVMTSVFLLVGSDNPPSL